MGFSDPNIQHVRFEFRGNLILVRIVKVRMKSVRARRLLCQTIINPGVLKYYGIIYLVVKTDPKNV